LSSRGNSHNFKNVSKVVFM